MNNELRWILAIAGVALLGVLYLFSRRRGGDDYDSYSAEISNEPSVGSGFETPASGARVTPVLNVDPPGTAAGDPDTHHDSPHHDPNHHDSDTEPASVEATGAPVIAEKIIALHLVPVGGQQFAGNEFLQALQGEGLKFGRFDIFHRFAGDDSSTDAESLFSVANLVKPGSFNLAEIAGQEVRGASMFLVLPGPEDPVATFADMLATGRRLAATLGGQLVDSHGTAVSRQCASHMREEIINYQHGLQSKESAF